MRCCTDSQERPYSLAFDVGRRSTWRGSQRQQSALIYKHVVTPRAVSYLHLLDTKDNRPCLTSSVEIVWCIRPTCCSARLSSKRRVFPRKRFARYGLSPNLPLENPANASIVLRNTPSSIRRLGRCTGLPGGHGSHPSSRQRNPSSCERCRRDLNNHPHARWLSERSKSPKAGFSRSAGWSADRAGFRRRLHRRK